MQRAADDRLAAAAHASARTVDLQIDLVDYSGRLVCRCGGLWDRVAREFVGDAKTSRVIKVNVNQVPAVEFFDKWLDSHLSGETDPDEDPVYAVLTAGGRRGGKTFIGELLSICYAVAVPDAIVWDVAPSDTYYEELIGYIEDMMPRAWYESLGWPHWTYFLVNGSKMVLRSGFTPKKLKKGRADFVFVNEAQQIKQQSWNNLRASTSDMGGLIWAAANPPDVGDDGTWVADMAAECERGQRSMERYYFFDPMKNPEIDHRALEAMAASMSKHEFDVQVRGMFLLPPDSVLHAWDRVDSEKAPPEIGDCTREFVAFHEGSPASDIVCVDVQNFPWIAAVRMRAFRNPDHPRDMTKAYLWCVGEAFIDKGDEIDCAEQLKADGVDGADCILIVDASARWQQQQRDHQKQRPMFTGKGSMDMFRAAGFQWVVPPDRELKGNPDVVDRCRAANARICNGKDKRMVFADPVACPLLVASIRGWRVVNGKPSRYSKHAHGGDAMTYGLWRFFPRRRRPGKVEHKRVQRPKRGDSLKGI